MFVKGIDIGAGVIDRDYRGELKILLINNSKDTVTFSKGDRIAQLILEDVVRPHTWMPPVPFQPLKAGSKENRRLVLQCMLRSICVHGNISIPAEFHSAQAM